MSHSTSQPSKVKPQVVSSLSGSGATEPSRLEPLLSRHCLGTLIVSDPTTLFDMQGFSDALQNILTKENVHCLGQVNHTFPNKSFTVAAALAESHISVHTWPERHVVQLDVFLCNYINDNRDKCERIFNAIVEYFDAVEVDSAFIDRR